MLCYTQTLSVSIPNLSVCGQDRSYGMKAATKALADVFGKEPFLTREGASIPIVNSFASILGAPTVLMRFGLPGQDAHSQNEKMNLKNFHRTVKCVALFYVNLK